MSGMKYKDSLQFKKNRVARVSMFVMICLFLTAIIVLGCATHTSVPDKRALSSEVSANEMSAAQNVSVEEKWGVRIIGARLTANSYMIDFRYKVIDAEKASHLMDRNAKPYMIDEANSAKVAGADSSMGSLRSKGTAVNRNYFVLFGNPGGAIKPGSKVTIVIGDFKVEHLAVE